jgi:hypothetical protein
VKCPCKDCLCVPICSNKLYFTLLSDCFLLEKYVNTFDDGRTLRTAQNILHPQWWKSAGKYNITIMLGDANQKEY